MGKKDNTDISLELKKKIILHDPNLTLEEMVEIMCYLGYSNEDIAEKLVWNVSFEKLREDYEKVGQLLELTFEEYRAIWRGYKRK